MHVRKIFDDGILQVQLAFGLQDAKSKSRHGLAHGSYAEYGILINGQLAVSVSDAESFFKQDTFRSPDGNRHAGIAFFLEDFIQFFFQLNMISFHKTSLFL